MESSCAVAAETYRFVDDIPEVYAERQAERRYAENLLSQRRQAFGLGQETDLELPPVVDALSTAHKVLTAETTYGFNSPQRQELYDGLLLDCQRAVGEWYRKLTSEYFEPLRHTYDENAQSFFSHGMSIRQMTENAIRPVAASAEEESRRINEYVEDATPRIVRGLGASALGHSIRTISECPDYVLNAYASDVSAQRKSQGYYGYVPEIQKQMIRDIRLDPHSLDRFEEQVGLPGEVITPEIMRLALERRGLQAEGLGKTELHGAQFLASDDILDFIKHLDAVASEQWCATVFMGEIVTADHPKDYAAFRREALERQASLTEVAGTVTTFVLQLARENTDRAQALQIVENFVKRQLLELGKADFSKVTLMFDQHTANGLQQAMLLETQGQFELAQAVMEQVIEQAPGGGYCGAGSCGLEGIDMQSESGKALAKKLGAQSGDTVLKDTERACRCGKKSIVYAFNAQKVSKYCESCGASETKITTGTK